MAKIDDSVKKKVPELRFEGFADDWEERKLSDVANHRGGTAIEKYFDKDGVYKVISIGSYGLNSQYVDQNIRAISNEITDGRVVNSGELTMVLNDKTANGTIIGRTLLVEKDNEYVINQRTEIISPKENFDSNFAYTILNGPFREKVKRIVQGGTQIYVNYPAVSNLNLELPKIEEQQKIGSFFKQLDDTIALHQRKLDLLKEQKKGYLQKMFPKNGAKVPELRFAGFADDWEERKLGDTLTELKSGLSRMLSNNDIGLPVVRANNINDGQFNIDSDVKYWYVNDPQGANTVNYLIRKNDILINFINSEAKMGTATIVENTPIRDTIYTTNILRARLKKEYDSYYWFALTQINQYKINIKIITKPAVNQASFTTVDFKKLNFMFPNLKEQQKIGSFFKQLDDTIALHQRKLDLLKEQKKGFLQKMFV